MHAFNQSHLAQTKAHMNRSVHRHQAKKNVGEKRNKSLLELLQKLSHTFSFKKVQHIIRTPRYPSAFAPFRQSMAARVNADALGGVKFASVS